MNELGSDRPTNLQIKPRPVEAARRPAPVEAKPGNYSLSAVQLEQVKTAGRNIDYILQWAAIGIFLGSATGALGALSGFLTAKALTFSGFVQNIIFFSALFVSLILVLTNKSKRDAFAKLIEDVTAQGTPNAG